MKSFPQWSPLLASAMALNLMAGCGGGTVEPSSAKHAEEVYGQYQAAAPGRITFELDTLKSGALREVAEQPVNALVGVPDSHLSMSFRGTDITALRLEQGRPAGDEWAVPVNLKTFDSLGHPVDAGSYRLLAVRTVLDGVRSEHRALEVCWTADRYCLVMDPVVKDLETFANTRRRLVAEGWAPVEQFVEAPRPSGVAGLAGVCTLNSAITSTTKSRSYSGYRVTYTNLYGITVVEKTVGAQQVGISCYKNSAGACVSSGFGYSNASSCWANVGFSCDCENTGNLIGASADGAATKAWSETRCAHQAILTASAAFTLQGSGASFNVNWQTSGSVDSNGGQMYDACSWH